MKSVVVLHMPIGRTASIPVRQVDGPHLCAGGGNQRGLVAAATSELENACSGTEPVSNQLELVLTERTKVLVVGVQTDVSSGFQSECPNSRSR